MAQTQPRKSSADKIEEARDLQAKLYREIGISAVAAALRFANSPDVAPTRQTYALQPSLHGDGLAA